MLYEVITDGDKRLQTLNVIDAANANKYQLNEDTPKLGGVKGATA